MTEREIDNWSAGLFHRELNRVRKRQLAYHFLMEMCGYSNGFTTTYLS